MPALNVLGVTPGPASGSLQRKNPLGQKLACTEYTRSRILSLEEEFWSMVMASKRGRANNRTHERAEILSHAASIFGSRAEAKRWLERPALGLNQRRPADLLETPAGIVAVEDYLWRLEFGVYT